MREKIKIRCDCGYSLVEYMGNVTKFFINSCPQCGSTDIEDSMIVEGMPGTRGYTATRLFDIRQKLSK